MDRMNRICCIYDVDVPRTVFVHMNLEKGKCMVGGPL